MPTEIRPGLFHWTTPHPRIKIEVSSYWLEPERTLIDPLEPPGDGLGWWDGRPAAEQVVLTNRHHYRDAAKWNVPVHVHADGLHEFGSGEDLETYRPGDELPGGIHVQAVGAICPDESALFIPAHRALAVADGVVRMNGPLTFVPDQYMDDPEKERAELRAAYRRLLELDFDTLLLAHGDPLVGNGKDALREFVSGGS